MIREYAFYITNHGYGHASRNVVIIEKLFEINPESIVHIKTDAERADFMKRNLERFSGRIYYYPNYTDVGIILHSSTFEVNVAELEKSVIKETNKWAKRIKNEKIFFKEHAISCVISDIHAWVLIAAKECRIPSILLCNFTWYEMYRDFLNDTLCRKYYNAYCHADKIFLYALGNREILDFETDTEQVSMLCRKKNSSIIKDIVNFYRHPIVFFSVGKSVELQQEYEVSDIEGTFITTVGVYLKGNNVVSLPPDTINTQDYICASDYIITKSGWSTLAEVFLNKKKAAILPRGKNSEDIAAMSQIEETNIGMKISIEDLANMKGILNRLDKFEIDNAEIYQDSCLYISNYISEV